MVEKAMTEIEEFKAFANWARLNGARRVKNEHMEVEFYMDPRVFAPVETEPPADALPEEREEWAREQERKRLFRSAT